MAHAREQTLIANTYENDNLSILQTRHAWAYEHFEARWRRKTDHIYNKLRIDINKILSAETSIYRQFERQADKAKPYVRLTRYANPFSNPLKFLDCQDQLAILEDLVDELQPRVTEQYGLEFTIEVQTAPVTISNVVTFIFYDLYLFYQTAIDLN